MALLTEFTARMFIKSAHGDFGAALDLAQKTEQFYERYKSKNKIAALRCSSASRCFCEIFNMMTREKE